MILNRDHRYDSLVGIVEVTSQLLGADSSRFEQEYIGNDLQTVIDPMLQLSKPGIVLQQPSSFLRCEPRISVMSSNASKSSALSASLCWISRALSRMTRRPICGKSCSTSNSSMVVWRGNDLTQQLEEFRDIPLAVPKHGKVPSGDLPGRNSEGSAKGGAGDDHRKPATQDQQWFANGIYDRPRETIVLSYLVAGRRARHEVQRVLNVASTNPKGESTRRWVASMYWPLAGAALT